MSRKSSRKIVNYVTEEEYYSIIDSDEFKMMSNYYEEIDNVIVIKFS